MFCFKIQKKEKKGACVWEREREREKDKERMWESGIEDKRDRQRGRKSLVFKGKKLKKFFFFSCFKITRLGLLPN
jgi:hypothetical protein